MIRPFDENGFSQIKNIFNAIAKTNSISIRNLVNDFTLMKFLSYKKISFY